MPRHWRFRLNDILDCIDRINRYTEDMASADFVGDELRIDAVLRNFEIIGEAARQVPDDVKSRWTEVPLDPDGRTEVLPIDWTGLAAI